MKAITFILFFLTGLQTTAQFNDFSAKNPLLKDYFFKTETLSPLSDTLIHWNEKSIPASRFKMVHSMIVQTLCALGEEESYAEYGECKATFVVSIAEDKDSAFYQTGLLKTRSMAAGNGVEFYSYFAHNSGPYLFEENDQLFLIFHFHDEEWKNESLLILNGSTAMVVEFKGCGDGEDGFGNRLRDFTGKLVQVRINEKAVPFKYEYRLSAEKFLDYYRRSNQ